MRDHFATSAVWTGRRLSFVNDMAYHVGVRRLKLGVGEEVEVRVEKLEAARTRKQNAAYWGFIVKPTAMHSEHYSMADIHRIFKAELLPSERFTLADPKTGEVRLERDLELHTTTVLTEQEFSEYMERARAFACETVGVDLSDRGLLEMGILKG